MLAGTADPAVISHTDKSGLFVVEFTESLKGSFLNQLIQGYVDREVSYGHYLKFSSIQRALGGFSRFYNIFDTVRTKSVATARDGPGDTICAVVFTKADGTDKLWLFHEWFKNYLL